MKTQFKGLTQIYILGFVLAMFMSITSCDNQELSALTALVPEGQTDKIAYINQAIALKNSFEIAKKSKDRVGYPISQGLSNQITRFENKSLDSTKAVFFSFTNIVETIEQIGLNNIDSTFGLAVVFGRYPNEISGAFETELKAKNLDPSEYRNTPTVVLKYVRNLSTKTIPEYYTNKVDTNSTNKLAGDNLGPQYITNMGKPCPKDCPPGTE